jgi:hypothetical protein
MEKISPSQWLSTPEAPPIRPQRHVPNSITTIRRELAAAIAKLDQMLSPRLTWKSGRARNTATMSGMVMMPAT